MCETRICLQACKADFCWVCLGPWEPHGSSWYNCNRYDEDEARANRDNQETSRSALQRYLFYCNRYMNHLQSLKFENKLYSMVKVSLGSVGNILFTLDRGHVLPLQDKMEEMQQHNMSWIEVQFLRKAVDILCECRRTLMYTYVFAYYLSKNNQSEIFEASARVGDGKIPSVEATIPYHFCSRLCRIIRRTWNNQRKSCPSTSSGRFRWRI